MRTQIPLCALVIYALSVPASGCIKRTATPPPTAASTQTAQASTALEAANARIADVPRADLLGGAGTSAFNVMGEVQKVGMTTVPVTGQPFSEALRLEIKEP